MTLFREDRMNFEDKVDVPVEQVAMFRSTSEGDVEFYDIYDSVAAGLRVAESYGFSRVCFVPWKPEFYSYGGWTKE